MPDSFPSYVDIQNVLVDGEQYEVEDSDDGEEEEEDDDEETDDGEETVEGHAEENADNVIEAQSPRASQTGPSRSGQARVSFWVEEEEDKRRRTEGGEASSSNGVGSLEISQGNEWNRNEIDGLFCPICMEAWTNYGDHHIWYVQLIFFPLSLAFSFFLYVYILFGSFMRVIGFYFHALCNLSIFVTKTCHF